jgi:hypothetical protein
MKICPTCKRSYSDDSQTFCLDDGTRLIDQASEPLAATIMAPFQPSAPPPPTQLYNQPPPSFPSQQPSAVPPQFSAPGAATTPRTSRNMLVATIALVLGFVCLFVMIHLTYTAIAHSWEFTRLALPRIIFSSYGVEFFLGVAIDLVTLVLAAIAITMASRQPTVYAGRGRSLAAILMAVLSTIVAVAAFSVQRLRYRPSYPVTSYYTPATNKQLPATATTRDFVKSKVGSFTLIKSMDRDDVRKISSGQMLSNIDRANDVAAGVYRSPASTNLSLIVSSYSDTATPTEIMNAFEQDMRGADWKNYKNTPQPNGRMVEAEALKGGALVVWNDGRWLFMTYAPNLTDATWLANSLYIENMNLRS